MEQIFQLIVNHDLNALKKLLETNRSLAGLRSGYGDAQKMIDSEQFTISDPEKIEFFINTTPLHISVYLNQLDTCHVLLDHNADINAKDNFYYTPLIYAAYCDRHEILSYFIERGAHINLQDLVGRTALHWAARKGHLNCVKYLSQSQPATLSAPDKGHKTALDLAVHHNHQGVVNYFNQIRASTS